MEKLESLKKIEETEPSLKYYDENAYENAVNIPKNKSLWDVLEEKLLEYVDIPAIEYFKREFSRPDFSKSVEIWARSFKAMGISEGEIVPIYGPFFPDICAMTCALNAIGAVSYFLKLEISEKALREETADSKVAVVYDGMWNNVKSVFMDDKFKKIIVATAADSMIQPKKSLVTFLNYIQYKKNHSLIPRTNKYIWIDEAKQVANYYTGHYKADFIPNRKAFITSSSGTSINGVVKGTEATNEAAIYQLYKAEAAEVNYNVGKKCLTNLPPTASTSLNCLFFLPIFKGMTVINEPRLSEATYYNQVMAYKPQVALMTGSFWESFFRKLENELKKGKKIDLSFFEMPIIGGEGVTPESLQWMNKLMFENKSNVPVFNGYGLSEVFSVLSVEKLGAQPSKKSTRPVISVGLPYPGVEIGVFDKDGNKLGANQRGELWVKDPSMMQGYYGKKELTEKTIVDGWLHTGDISDRDEDGFLYIWGRSSNSIQSKDGELIYLFDIENKIRENEDVKEAIVNAMPLHDGTYSLVAHLLLKNDVLDLNELYKRIDSLLKNFLPNNIIIDGYKVHNTSFPISPTTAKKDRKGMMKDLSGYVKVLDETSFSVSYSLEKNVYEKHQIPILKDKVLVKRRK